MLAEHQRVDMLGPFVSENRFEVHHAAPDVMGDLDAVCAEQFAAGAGHLDGFAAVVHLCQRNLVRLHTSRRLQFSIASLLVLQAAVGLVFGIGSGFGWPVAVAIVILTTMLTLTVVGTVWIAGEWGRSVRVAKVAAKVLVALALILVAVMAISVLAG